MPSGQEKTMCFSGFLLLCLAVWADHVQADQVPLKCSSTSSTPGTENVIPTTSDGPNLHCPSTHEQCNLNAKAICCDKRTSTCGSSGDSPTCDCKGCKLCPSSQSACCQGTQCVCCTNHTAICDLEDGPAYCCPCSGKDTRCCKEGTGNTICSCCTHRSGKYCLPDHGKCSACKYHQTPCCPESIPHPACVKDAKLCCHGEFGSCSKEGKCVNQHGCTQDQKDCCNIKGGVDCLRNCSPECKCCNRDEACTLQLDPSKPAFVCLKK